MRLILFLILFIISFNTLGSRKVVFLADEWCPYNCKPNSKRPGFIVEVLKVAFKKHNIEVEYRNEGWVRSIRLAKEGKVNGIIGAYKEDAPGFIFPKEELLVTKNLFFVKKDSKIKSLSEKDIYANKHTLGVIKGYYYTDEFDKYTTNPDNKVTQLHGVLPIESLIKMLHLGRIDIALEEANVWSYNVGRLGLKRDSFRSAGVLLADNLYVAFSPSLDTSKRLSKLFSKELSKMKKSGEYDLYLKKYGLKYK